ncbi:hypothetical protein [Flagellimonas crocea]|uniref:hypothetical protein n=1 Tax=Flagellimonas crocea TaxID=3067311 RepID=UPI00296F49E2|nr:hypothetical protein [Muricauda sp. DH64]
MKNIIKKFGILFAGVFLVFTSCEKNEVPVIDYGEGFVQLNSTTGSIPENSEDPIVTTVLLGNDGTNPNGVTVNFTVTSSDDSRFTVTPSNGTIEIPAGEFSADIVIQPVDNLDADGDVEVTLELDAGSDLPIGIAGEGLVATSRSITITDNDCPTVFSSAYSVSVFAFDEEAPSFNVDLIPVDGTDNQFTIESSWGPNFVAWATGDSSYEGQFPYSGTITVNEDFSVDFAGDASWATGGTGTYTACGDRFEITLTQALFSGGFTVDIVMVGQ